MAHAHCIATCQDILEYGVFWYPGHGGACQVVDGCLPQAGTPLTTQQLSFVVMYDF